MTDTRSIELASIPGATSMLLKSAISRKHSRGVPRLVPLQVSAAAVSADARQLRRFRLVCHYLDDGRLPLLFPQIMAMPLQLRLMSEPEFPYRPVGAVHVRNQVRQLRALHDSEALDLTVRTGSLVTVSKGVEISLISEARVAGELVWDSVMTILVRKGGSGGANKDRTTAAKNVVYGESVQWQLEANMGRRYAVASGDYNPIHLYPLTAKLMGFTRQIMHGMWSKSRIIAHLLPADYTGPVAVDVAFKLPVFLPALVTLGYNRSGDGCQFVLRDGRGEKPHLAGEMVLGEGAFRNHAP